MLSLLLIAIYALVCLAQIIYVLRSKPAASVQQDLPEQAQMAWWWLGFPV